MYALRSLREDRGYSQKDISAALNVATSTYNQWETGKREPDNATLLRIADFFHVSTDCLLGHSIASDQPKPAPDIEAAKVALFGGDGEVTDEMWEEALFAAQMIKERYRRKKND